MLTVQTPARYAYASFPQLLLHKQYPNSKPVNVCRECGGGIFSPAESVSFDGGNSWVDEGIIAITRYNHNNICQECATLKTKSVARTLIYPSKFGTVVFASPGMSHPDISDVKTMLQTCKKVPYPPVTIWSFIHEAYPAIEPPFGVAVNIDPSKQNQKHYMRYIPLNYHKNGIIKVLAMPYFEYGEIRTEPFILAVEEILEEKPSGRQRSKKIEELKNKFKLNWLESRLLVAYEKITNTKEE